MNLDPKKFKWWCCLKGVIGYYSKVVELILHYCGQILYDSFETYKTILRRIFTELDGKVDFRSHLFVWIRFENIFF